MANGIEVLELDFVGLLRALAGGEWKETPGPRSRCGLDYWYESADRIAYISVDQMSVVVSLEPDMRFEAEIGKGTLLDRFVREA